MNPARKALTGAVNRAITSGAPIVTNQSTAPRMRFVDLPIGATFDFVPPDALPGAVSCFDRCQKTSARKYQSLNLPNARAYHVGAVNVAVYHVDLADAGHILSEIEIAARLSV